MLEDSEEGGVRLWHLVKAPEEPEAAKARRSSLRDRERERARAKAIPEIYLTRLLSMKVGLPGRLSKGTWTDLGRCCGTMGLATAQRASHLDPPPQKCPVPCLLGHTAEVCG